MKNQKPISDDYIRTLGETKRIASDLLIRDFGSSPTSWIYIRFLPYTFIISYQNKQ